MTLLTAHSLSKSYGAKTLFRDISLTISRGDRVGFIGPNGTGKSSLLKILADIEPPDSGDIIRKQGLRVGYASQMPEFPDLPMLEMLAGDDPEKLVRAQVLLGKAQFMDLTKKASELSGGWKKRLDIVRALLEEPDLLLLDEPTNHLDLEGILWLEGFLQRLQIAFVVISHDRYFLEAVSSKIMELNPCYPKGIFECDGGMRRFYEVKADFLEAQTQQEKGLKSALRKEIEWLRSTPKARTTKSESRVKRAHQMMDTLQNVKERNRSEVAKIDFAASQRQTRKLIVAKNIGKTMGGKSLFSKLDVVLSPGVRLGVLGKNGTGKTTLLRLLARELDPDEGNVKYADDLELVYFDQHREKIPLDVSLREALCPSGDQVYYLGRAIHVVGWAKKFLFDSDRLDLPVRMLSGGERARILIAKLMLKPADVLFLDEPTNDLDIQTLEVIEESLMEFPGAVVLISHDRCLMDRVCTGFIELGEEETEKPKEKKEKKKTEKKGLSYHEQRELSMMEEKVLKAEEELAELEAQLTGGEQVALYEKMGKKQKELDGLYERWQELEKRV